MTGTMTEILDCGHSYMIQAPNSRVYRRNRAHLKPICYDGTSFQDHSVKQEKKQPKTNSFQDHQPTKVKCVSFQTDTSYMDIRSMLFDEPDLPQTPHPSPGSITPVALLTQITIIFTPHIHSHQDNHQWSPAQSTLHPKAGKDTSLNQLSSDPVTLTEDSHMELSALLKETSPLAPYKLKRSAKAKARQAFSMMH